MTVKDEKINNLSPLVPTILGKIKKMPWILGKRAFYVVLALILIDVIFGALVFYKYIFLVDKSQPKTADSDLIFKEDVYYGIIKNLQLRDQRMQEFLEEEKMKIF